MEDHWKLLLCDNGSNKLLAKLRNQDSCSSYEIVLSDLVNVWIETVTLEEITKRCKQLNRRLEAPPLAIMEHLNVSLTNSKDNSFSTKLSDSKETLNLSTRTTFPGGIPFNWEFSCKLLDSKEASKLFCSPLLKLASSLLCVNKELETIIRNKDKEIRDYKESGAVVSRPYLETQEFDSDKFCENFRKSLNYCNSVTKDAFSLASDNSLNTEMATVEKYSKCPEVYAIASGISNSPKVHGPNRVGGKMKRGVRKVRHPLKGVEVASDSDDDTNDRPAHSPSKKMNVTQPQKFPQKKKVLDKKKKKLF